MNKKTPEKCFKDHRALTKGRVDKNNNPIEFKLTFEEWWDIWQSSGHWQERGRRPHQYVMSRINDIGHYEVGNVQIITWLENWMAGCQSNAPGWPKRKIMTPAGEFESILFAAKSLKVTRQTIYKKLKSDPTLYYYL